MSNAVPILAYANPRGGQPAGSLFDVEPLPDGVRLAKPIRPDWPMAVAIVVLAGVAATFAVWAATKVVADRARYTDDVIVDVVVGLLLVSIAVWLLRRAVIAKRPRVLTVEVRPGRLTVTHGPVTLLGGPLVVRRPRGCVVVGSGFDLVTRRPMGRVVIRRSWGWSRQILDRLPRDECLWLADLLNAALAAPHGAGR